jgi:hypothetical protein
MNRSGAWNICFEYFDPKAPYDTVWTQFAYPVPSHFFPRLRECNTIDLMFFINDEFAWNFATKFPIFCGQINAGWQAHFKHPINLDDILAADNLIRQGQARTHTTLRK